MTTGTSQAAIALVDDDGLPDLVVLRGNITLRKATEQWPRTDWREFAKPTQRYAPVRGRRHLRADCSLVMADAEILAEAGLPAGAKYVESQVVSVGFWSAAEARFHRGSQLCLSDKESLTAEADVYEQL